MRSSPYLDAFRHALASGDDELLIRAARAVFLEAYAYYRLGERLYGPGRERLRRQLQQHLDSGGELRHETIKLWGLDDGTGPAA